MPTSAPGALASTLGDWKGLEDERLWVEILVDEHVFLYKFLVLRHVSPS